MLILRGNPLQLTRRAAFILGEPPLTPALFSLPGRGVVQLVSSADVYVLDLYEEVVNVGVLLRWLFRLVLFRVLVSLWRIVRRR